MYHNPVIKGFNPDPSVCKSGDKFYLVTSTFEFFPALPIYESNNLTNWRYIDSVLKTPETARLKGASTSRGHYAPTIRHHEGVFYVVCTNKDLDENFIVWSEDIHGPWQGPFPIRKGGIDPSIFFDEDGSCFYTQNGATGGEKGGILGFYIDPKTGEKLSEEIVLTRGISRHATEAPHIYKRDGWYYLIFAEGGTGFGHHEEVIRSRSLAGPWEYRGGNILSHTSRKDFIIQATGHADLIEYEKNKWCAFFLGVRKFYKPGINALGRESYLAPVTWIDDWPVIGDGGHVEIEMEGFDEDEKTERLEIPFSEGVGVDRHLLKLRMPNDDRYLENRQESTLTLISLDRLDKPFGEPTALFLRQSERDQYFKAILDLSSLEGKAGAGIWATSDYYYRIIVRRTKSGRYKCSSSLRVHGFERTLKECYIDEEAKSVTLEVKAFEDRYAFFAGDKSLGDASFAGVAQGAFMYGTFTGSLFFIYSEGGRATFLDGLLRT